MFSPESFMNAVMTDANDTKIIPCPPGEWSAQCVDAKARSGIIGKGDRAGEPWAQLVLTWETHDTAVTSVTQRDPTRVIQSIMLDLTDQGNLDMGTGKNVQLGRAREATGLNVPGQPFSPTMFVGRSARVNVKHKIDERDGVTILAEVAGVAKM